LNPTDVFAARLQEARGGEIAVREGVVSQRPAVTVQPLDVTVDEGGNAQLSVVATVSRNNVDGQATSQHKLLAVGHSWQLLMPLTQG
jgi:hypothetical protein